MSRRAGWIGAALLVLMLLPVAAAGLAAGLIDPDAYKPRIVALVAAQTGRTLSLNGPIRIGWSFHPTLSIVDARLSNLAGGSRADMARVERIEAELSLVSLLRRRIDIIRLTLVGPNILFEQVSGQPNWVFHRQGDSSNGPSDGFGLGIERVHVQNGMVTFHFPARTNVIGLRSLDYAHPDWTAPLTLDGVLVYSDFQPFSLHGSAVPSGGVLDPWRTTLEADAFQATAKAEGTMSLAGPFALAVSVQAPALERLNRLLPEMHLPALHGLTVAAHVRSGPEQGDLPILGQSSVRFDSADLGDRIAGLSLSDVAAVLPKEGGVASLTGAGRYRTQGFRLTSSMTMPVLLDQPSRSPVGVMVRTDGDDPDVLSLQGRLGLAKSRLAGFDGTVALTAKALAAFQPVVSPALPPLTGLTLKAGLTVPPSRDRVLLHGLMVTAREGDVGGDATIALGGETATGTLRSTRLDLDSLLPAGGASGSGPVMTARLPWDGLRGRTLDLSWQAATLRYGGQDWPDLRVAVTLEGGRLAVMLPGGLATGSLSVDAGQPVAAVRLVLQTPAFPLAPLAAMAGLAGTTTGTLSLSAELAGRGDTLQALDGTLDGSVSIATQGASVTDQAMAGLAGPALKQLGGALPHGGRTTIRCLDVQGTVSGGVMKLGTIALDAGTLTMSGFGTVDLGHRTLALKLHPLARLAGSRVAVPVVVSGSFDHPQPVLDASGLDKVGLLIDALFGGDHPRVCVK